jgi:hypothetical protein
VNLKLVALADVEGWTQAVTEVAHAPAHTQWYNAALAASASDPIVLISYASRGDRAVCPVMLRRYAKSVDIVSPYGFGGFAARGPCAGLPGAFRSVAIEQGWVCGYIALHPLLAHPFGAVDGIEKGRTVYVLDLAGSEENLLASMHEAHRYEIRRDAGLLTALIEDRAVISRSLPALYADTLKRVGASGTYGFSAASLDAWLASPGCLALGLGEPLRAAVLCLHAGEMGEYFINASTDDGRSHTRILLWAAMRELKRRGVRYFNLGGGAHEGDALDAFKRRFGGNPLSVPVLKQVFVRDRYDSLCRQAGTAERVGGYFPPYRST